MTPDPGWIPYLKMTFGFLLLVILGVLAAAIALGEVKESTSFGLDQVLGGLLVLAGGFAHWAYGADQREK
jgi:thiol:disulfide interchange protein